MVVAGDRCKLRTARSTEGDCMKPVGSRVVTAMALAALAALAGAATGVGAMQADSVQARTGAAEPTRLAQPVTLGADTLFTIETAIGPFTAAQRAEAVHARLAELARDPFARLDTIVIAEIEGRSDLMIGDLVLTTVTEADAAAAGQTREALARARAQAISDGLGRTALSRNLRSLALGVIYTMLATLAALLLLRGQRRLFDALRIRLDSWQRARLGSIRVQNLEVLSADRIGAVVTAFLKLLRIALLLLLGYVYLLLVFSFFPWTSGVAARLVDYAVEPIIGVFDAFLGYVPHIFYIVVIILTTRYVLKLIHLIFDGIESGAIKLANFYPEWAAPTYKIVRFLVIALALILVWPHLPSSDRPEFKGVAAFIGLLLSLGSASAVANVVGGVVMVYMRPFRIGDRVRIADTMGDIVERTLLVTRVRTTKNVDITIPNAMVLGSHIINYSTAGRDGRLVLHTTVTLGYDVPWRKVHQTLIDAARATTHIVADPAPFVLQTALNDYHVSYELNAYTDQPNAMARIYSELHQNIQDACARAGIEIMSPAYQVHREGGDSNTIPVLPVADG
jgi:small-conductance mechanosensitive channel